MNNEELLQKILELEERIKVLENKEPQTRDRKENKVEWLNKNKEGKKFKEFYQELEIVEDDITYLLVKNIRCSDNNILWCFKDSKTMYLYNQSWKKMDINDINEVCLYLNTQLFNKLFLWANSNKNNIFDIKKNDSEILAINAKKLSDSKIYYTDFRKYMYENISRNLD